MLQNPCKTLGFKKNMVYKIPPGGGGKPYPASGLFEKNLRHFVSRAVLSYFLLNISGYHLEIFYILSSGHHFVLQSGTI